MPSSSFLRKKLDAARLRLSRYLVCESGPHGHIFRWYKRPPKTFPSALRRIIRFLLRQAKRPSLPPTPQQICLCADIPDCAFKKPGETENFDCPKFAFGICVPATLEANHQQPLSIETIGVLSGMSKQGFSRHVRTAQILMVQRILDDPDLKDYCCSLGIQPVMPTHLTPL